MVERQLDGANRPFVSPQIVQPLLELPRLLGRQFTSVQLLNRLVDLFGEKLTLVEDDQPRTGRARRLHEQPIVGILLAIPIHRRSGFQRPGVAVKHAQSRLFQVELNLGLQNIQVQFHRCRVRYQTLHGITRRAGIYFGSSRRERCYNVLLTRAPRVCLADWNVNSRIRRRARLQVDGRRREAGFSPDCSSKLRMPEPTAERNSGKVGGLAMYASAPSCNDSARSDLDCEEVRTSTGTPSSCFKLRTCFRISMPVTLGRFRSIMIRFGKCDSTTWESARMASSPS